MNKENFLVYGILVLIVLQIFFVSTQNEEGPTDITSEFIFEEGVDVSVSATNVELNPLSANRMDITGESSIKIGENEFNNLGDGGFIQLNSKGEVEEAEFPVTKGGDYVFGNQKIYAPENSKVSFKNGVISIDMVGEGDYSLENFPTLVDTAKSGHLVRIGAFGKDVMIPGGNFLNNGNLYFDEKGQAFIGGTGSVTINEVEIFNKGHIDLPIGFDKSIRREGARYITFEQLKPGTSQIFVSPKSVKEPIELTFKEGNRYIPVQESKNLIEMKLFEDAIIESPSGESLPVVMLANAQFTNGDYIIDVNTEQNHGMMFPSRGKINRKTVPLSVFLVEERSAFLGYPSGGKSVYLHIYGEEGQSVLLPRESSTGKYGGGLVNPQDFVFTDEGAVYQGKKLRVNHNSKLTKRKLEAFVAPGKIYERGNLVK